MCRTRLLNVVRIGIIRSKVSPEHPAKMEIFPVSSRWQLPETGQSTGAAPVASTSAPRRFTSASSVVDISAQIVPGASADRMPASASITAAEAAGEGRQVMTRSQAAAIAAGLSAIWLPHRGSAGQRRGRGRARSGRARYATVTRPVCRPRVEVDESDFHCLDRSLSGFVKMPPGSASPPPPARQDRPAAACWAGAPGSCPAAVPPPAAWARCRHSRHSAARPRTWR